MEDILDKHLKLSPEDFVVEEIPREWTNTGQFLICKLTKTNRTTEDVIQQVIKALNIPRNHVAYAGTKDKVAITSQYISIKNATGKHIENLHIDNTTIQPITNHDEPLPLGSLEANQFTITLRNLDKKIPEKPASILPNYFGKQRFSTKNVSIGLAILKKEWKKAADLLDDQFRSSALEHLQKNPNDIIGAVRMIPKKILSLYVHSVQSYCCNQGIAKLIEAEPSKVEFPFLDHTLMTAPELPLPIEPIEVPLIGFGTDEDDSNTASVATFEALEDFDLYPQDFIIRSIPDLSSEGTTRDAFIEIKDIWVENIDSSTQKISFTLPAGAYATMAIRQWLALYCQK